MGVNPPGLIKKLCYRKICKFPPIPLIIILKLLSEESSRWIGWEGFLDSIVDDWFRGLNIKYFNLIDWYLIYRVAHQRLNFNYDLNLGKFWSLLVCSLVFLQWVCFRVSTGNFISVSAPEIWLFFFPSEKSAGNPFPKEIPEEFEYH